MKTCVDSKCCTNSKMITNGVRETTSDSERTAVQCVLSQSECVLMKRVTKSEQVLNAETSEPSLTTNIIL